MDHGHALVMDPGGPYPELERMLQENDCILDAIVLTHAHFDHIGGIPSILKKHEIPVYVNPKEFAFFKDPVLNVSQAFMMNVTMDICPNPVHEGLNTIGKFKIKAIYTPGHSIGSTVYIIEDALFSGDCLFQGSIGRTDMATGSLTSMMDSLQKLKTLTKNYTVYPGHGPATTLEKEKQWNPYLR